MDLATPLLLLVITSGSLLVAAREGGLQSVLLSAVGAIVSGGICFFVTQNTVMSVWISSLACVLVAIADIDRRFHLIPDWLVVAVLAHAVLEPNTPLTAADKALGCIALVLLTLCVRQAYQAWRATEGLGLGDVKLSGAAGAVLGLTHALLAILIASIATALILFAQRKRENTTLVAPFGASIACAVFIVLAATLGPLT